VEDPTTIALNLTFFGTLGVAFLMFVGFFLVFVATLLIAGAGRLASVLILALFGKLPREQTVQVVRLPAPVSSDDDALASQPEPVAVTEQQDAPGTGLKAANEGGPRWPERLAPARIGNSLRAAVERLPALRTGLRSVRPDPAEMSADWAAAVAHADARAIERARAASGPEITAMAVGGPAENALAGQLTEIAPLVGYKRAPDRPVPASFVKPPPPGSEALLDTGSLVSQNARTFKTAVRK
jgi:hypothetical protein